MSTYRQTDRKIDRLTDRETGRETYRQTDSQTDRPFLQLEKSKIILSYPPRFLQKEGSLISENIQI